MKKFLLGLALVLGTSSANAAGLYISGGYGKADPDFGYKTKSLESASGEYGDDILELAGFPNGTKLANYSSSTKVGYQAQDWDAGLLEEYDYNTKGTNTTAFAIGWDISQNPFRFELEYQKTKFKSGSYVMTVNDPDGLWLKGIYSDDAEGDYTECLNGICVNIDGDYIPTSSYQFDVSFYKDMTTSVDAYMANVYFEIPGFGLVDPYIGYGYGKAKVDFTFFDEEGFSYSGGSDGYVNAKQFIAGVEYRFDETPFIVGAEYRQFKTDFNERDDGSPYSFKHKYFLLKLRYDFISDEF